MGQWQPALEYYTKALLLREKLGDLAGEARTLNNIGGTYYSLGRWKKALVFFERALPIHQEVGNRETEGTTLNNIGVIYNNLGMHEQALMYHQEALLIHQEVGNRQMEGTTLANIGMVYYATKQWEKAHHCYIQALSIHKEVGDQWNSPQHGYAIMKETAVLSDGRVQLSTSTLYGAIKRLLDLGWIERAAAASRVENGRERKAYQLTDLGRHILKAETARLQSLVNAAQQSELSAMS